MENYIEDKKLLAFTKLLIFDKSDPIGIPIGNYTSQFFANIYLDQLDQYVKRKLKLQFYVRYMDDFVILLKTKKDCIEIKRNIELFLQEKLHLELNEKSRYYPDSMGVNFCGYRIFTTHRLLRSSSKKKINKKVVCWNKKYKCGKLNLHDTMQSLNSWLGHSSHCNSYKLQNKIIGNCDFLLTDDTYLRIEKELIELIENDKKA